MKTISIFGKGGRGWLAAVIGVLGIVGGAREQAWANDIAFRDVVRRTDFLSAGIGGLRDVGSGTITVRGLNGPVHQAWLYWAGPSNSTNASANASITVNGRPVQGQHIGSSSDNFWGYSSSRAYRADVTEFVAAQGNGAYALAGLVKQGTNVNVNGASLLVFYNDSLSSNDRDIVLFDGNDSNNPNLHDMLGWNVRLAGIRYTNGAASLQLHVADGQAYKDGAIVVNTRTLIAAGSIFQGATTPSANNGPLDNGDLWDIRTFDVTSFLRPGTNTLNMTHRWINPGGDCVNLIVAAINLPAGAAPPTGPELTNNAPTVIAEPDMVINTRRTVVLHADVLDIDGDALTTGISVNGAMMYTGAFEKASPTTTGTLYITNAFELGDHEVHFSANDGKLSGEGMTALRVIDNTPPVLVVPDNIIRPTDPGLPTAVVTFVATATDDFDAVVTVICAPASGFAFPIGVTTVNCSATDSSTNTVTGSFTVTVTDALPPTIVCPADMVRPADRGTNVAVVTFIVLFTDNEPGATLSCVPPSGSLFPIGTTRVNCTARDAAGNTASCAFNITIVDMEPPVIIPPTNWISGNDLGQCSAVVNYTVDVSDNVAVASLRCVPASGSVFPLGTTVVTCAAVDTAGNAATNSFTVTIVDNEKPVLALPADIIAPFGRCKTNAVVNYTVTATDNCSTPVVVCVPKSGSTFPGGTNIVRCTATDAAGNVAIGSFKVIVRDTTPPVIKCITVTKRCLPKPNQGTYAVTLRVTATDNLGPVTSRIVSISSSTAGSTPSDWLITGPLTANLKAGQTYSIKVEARDNAGNVAYGTTTVVLPRSSSR